ncbi:MAG: hypothetical protein ACXWYG_09585 [Aeromicrobium sp.]
MGSPAASASSGWHVRDLHESDIERVVRLCEQTRGLPDSAPLDLVDLISSLR